MRLFKLITGSLVLAIIGLFIRQNLTTLKTVLPFTMDLYIREKLIWSHSLYALLLFAAFLGFFLGIVLMLKPYFNVRRSLAQERQERQEQELRQEQEQKEHEKPPVTAPSPQPGAPDEKAETAADQQTR